MIGWPKEDGLSSLFLGGSLRQVSLTLLGLFSPIYVFQSFRYSSSVGGKITFVLLFYMIMMIFKLIGLYFAENISQKIGFKGTIRLSLAPFVIFIPSLILGGNLPPVLLLAAASLGLHEGFFWWGFHGYFVKVSNSSHFGLSLGQADLFLTTAAIVTPFLGGILTTKFGFDFIFILSFIFMILSLIALGKDHDRKQHTDVRFADIVRLTLRHRNISIAYAGRGGELITYGIFWPLYLYFIFKNVLELGTIVSLAAILSAVFAVLVGKMTDSRGEKWAIKIGSPLTAFSWLLRFVSLTPAYILADSLRNFGQKLVGIPMDELSYKKARESSTGAAMLFREIGLTVGSMFAIILLAIIINLGENLLPIFIAGFALSLFPLISVRAKKFK